MEYIRNIKTYYWYSAFCDLLILGPILVLFLSGTKGLSFTEIMLLQSISAVAVVIFEVPTGAVADMIGRKESILLYSILCGLSLFIYIWGKSFMVFAIAEITFSLGASFKSGADSAIIYDSLKHMKKENEYQRIEGKARSIGLYTLAVGSIVSSFVYEIHPYLPFIISGFFMLATGIITLTFKEPPFQEKSKEISLKGYLNQIVESGKFILTHEKLKAVVIFTMVFMIFYRTGFWYFQPYMEAVNIPVRYFGVLFFFFNMTAAFFSKRSYYIMEKTKPRTLTFMAGLMILSFIIMGIVKIQIGVLAILLQQAARGLYRPITSKYLNKHIPSDKRATVLSFHGLLTNLAIAVSYPAMGVLKDNTNIFTTHIILGALMIVLLVPITCYMNSRIGMVKGSTEAM